MTSRATGRDTSRIALNSVHQTRRSMISTTLFADQRNATDVANKHYGVAK